MATDTPSWLTEENVKSAIKVSENPTARKVLYIFKNTKYC